MPKLPSVQTLLDALYATTKRFPLPILFTIIGCITSMRLLHSHEELLDSRLAQEALCAYFGMLLTLGATVFAERRGYRGGMKALVLSIAVALVVAYFYSLPDGEMNATTWLRSVLFVLGLHLFIAFAPWLVRNEANGFWQYNERLFLRFLTSILYATVLYLGLALALLAIDELFHADLEPERYGDLWIWIAGCFNTVFFLAGFPSGYGELERATAYPRGLKIFTQYVLLPLVTIYILILYAYMFKIMVTRQWPYGWVSWLVLSFAISGILSLLLIHPIRNEEDNKWIGLFSHGFYIALCPLIVLLFLAIEKRIDAYGITIERYFVLALSIWLALMALYFLISRSKSIKVLPVSLCLLVFLASFGPWGAFSVSIHNQRARLERLLAKNGMLPHGKFEPTGRLMPYADRDQISSIVGYLVRAHGYATLQPLFTQDLDSLMGVTVDGQVVERESIVYSFEKTERMNDLMQLRAIDTTVMDVAESTWYHADPEEVLPVKGYDLMISGYHFLNSGSDEADVKSYSAGGHSISIHVERETKKISISDERHKPLDIPLKALMDSLHLHHSGSNGSIPQKEMTLFAENELFAVECRFATMQFGEKLDLIDFSAGFLIRFKQ